MGFLIFLMMGVMIAAYMLPSKLALTGPFRQSLEVTDAGIALATVVAFLIAVTFLLDMLAVMVLVIDSVLHCWTKWQTRTFQELIGLFGRPPEGGTKEEPTEEEGEVEEKRVPESRLASEGRPARESIVMREVDLVPEAAAWLNPIVVRRPPGWAPVPVGRGTVHLGLAIGGANHWSCRGSIPRALALAGDDRQL